MARISFADLPFRVLGALQPPAQVKPASRVGHELQRSISNAWELSVVHRPFVPSRPSPLLDT